MEPLPREFYQRDTKLVACELLGKRLVRQLGQDKIVMEITETEAYLGIHDPACHSYGGRRTPRTETMYGPGGYAYIYLVYGMYHMLNAVTGREGDACAVLIRAGRILEGQDLAACNRFGKAFGELGAAQRNALSDGPGKLAAALALTRQENGLDLLASQLTIVEGEEIVGSIQAGPRIGVDYAGEAAKWPLNFRLMPGLGQEEG